MKTIQIIVYILFAFTIFSCGNRYKLNKDDFNYIPYDGTEVLVFQSDQDDQDTIFLTGHRWFNGCGDPLALFPDKCEGYSISSTKTDPNYDRYLKGKGFVDIVATSRRETRISFEITLKRSWFYNDGAYSLKEFDNIPNYVLTIGKKTYTDVKKIEANDYAKQFEDRDNFAERFYWSVSEGFLGLDRRNEKWRLVKKYVP